MYKVFFENWEGYFLDETFETYEEAVEYAEKEFEDWDEPDANLLIFHNNKVVWEAGEEKR